MVLPLLDPQDDEYTVVAGHTLTIDAPGFLANDTIRDDTPFGIDTATGGGFSQAPPRGATAEPSPTPPIRGSAATTARSTSSAAPAS